LKAIIIACEGLEGAKVLSTRDISGSALQFHCIYAFVTPHEPIGAVLRNVHIRGSAYIQ